MKEGTIKWPIPDDVKQSTLDNIFQILRIGKGKSGVVFHIAKADEEIDVPCSRMFVLHYPEGTEPRTIFGVGAIFAQSVERYNENI